MKNMIVYSGKNNFSLSYTDKEKWKVSNRGKEVEINNKNSYIYLLPLLEENVLGFYDFLKLNSLQNIFPFSEFILFSLDSESLYWIELASRWLIQSDSVFNFNISKEEFLKLNESEIIPGNIKLILEKHLR